MRRGVRLIVLAAAIAAFGMIFVSLAVRAGAQSEYRPPDTADPTTQLPEHRMTSDDLERLKRELSNWGRWGNDDERGTLNLITPQKTQAAARLIKDGVVVSLAHFAFHDKAIDAGGTEHLVSAPADWDWKTQPRAMVDRINFGIHDGTNSHMDAICHYQTLDGKFMVYNGHPAGFGPEGCQASSIERMGQAFATRAVLVDMPLLRGVPYLPEKTALYASDLEAWEKFANVKIGSGDVLLIRTGRWALRAEKGPFTYNSRGPGLHLSVAPWLKQRDIALLGSDGVNDVQPSGVVGGTGGIYGTKNVPGQMDRPLHNLLLVYFGMPLVDNGYFEDVAREAAARKRWEFFITVTPNRIEHGSASPFNAAAVF
jgi:kynurenine formamidase